MGQLGSLRVQQWSGQTRLQRLGWEEVQHFLRHCHSVVVLAQTTPTVVAGDIARAACVAAGVDSRSMPARPSGPVELPHLRALVVVVERAYPVVQRHTCKGASMPRAPPGHEGDTWASHSTSRRSLHGAIARVDAPLLQDHHVPWAAAAAAALRSMHAADSTLTLGAHDAVAGGDADADDAGWRDAVGDDYDDYCDAQSHHHGHHHTMGIHVDQNHLED